MKRWLSFTLLIFFLPLGLAGKPKGIASSATDRQASFFAQSAAQILENQFPSRDISFLLLDARRGDVIASRWDQPGGPIPLGSLVKPFTALAYGEQHGFRYPSHNCRGTATGCWRLGGHGEIDLTSAIAYSCNSYFRLLTAGMHASDVSPTALRFGLEPPARQSSGAALAGLGPEWQMSPLRMARAYVDLAREREQPGMRQIVAGMAESARQGTGMEVDRALRFPSALVKTGTAACTHSPHAPGDGFTIALFPADDPKVLLMVRVHGVPGAQAARTAGQMLRLVED